MFRIERKLNEKGIPFKLTKLSATAFTVNDVIALSDGEVAAHKICKTIIVKGKKTGKLYGIFIPGLEKISFSKLKKVFGEEMTMGTASEVLEVAGVEPGAVCPFLLTVPLYVDIKVEKIDEISSGSGEHLYGLEFKQSDLRKGVEYITGDFGK